jgi:uncharacterized alpha-E superfamily protein
MLSRIAESCYWIGRLVERADYTSRLLDVHYHNLIQSHAQESSRLAKHLVNVMGTSASPQLIDIEDAVAFIGFDPNFPGSISDSIFQLSENAKGVRDTIPSELFEAIYATSGELNEKLAYSQQGSRHELFQWVRNRCMLIHGVIDETMARDDSYHFLNAGRCIERVDMTARMVAVRCAMDNDTPGWLTMLRSCGAFEAFVRSRRDTSDTEAIIDFLLRNPQFPRSILSSASAALGSIQQLMHDDMDGRETDPRFALGRMCAEIEFASIQTISENLLDEVAHLQNGVRFVDQAMTTTFFVHQNAIEWRQ